ncbi:MAG: FAD-dependent oxidoreductase [Eubacteriaceae bacterium]|nr:FAD-dependent oxidoreductase [Eubacteriaceae bacterium]
MKHVIIGAGAAGIIAARTIRELKPNDEIVIISKDEHIISRCLLHRYICGERREDQLSFIEDGFFEDNRIEWIRGGNVNKLDASAKIVYYSGSSTTFDTLLIATGAKAFIPPVGTLRTAKNVFGLRDFGDAKAIAEIVETANKIVVIGAGFVDLDAAYAFTRLKKDVHIIDVAPHVLSANLDAQSAVAYQRRFEDAGCRFTFGYGVYDTVESEPGKISQVILENGQALDCDFVVVSTGVYPARELLDGSGVVIDKLAMVNEYMETNIKGIYAAGDVAGLSGIWPNARRQGEVAARNMCGFETVYEDSFALKNTVNFYDLATLTVGVLAPEDGDIVITRTETDLYQRLILRGGCVVGAILQGDISNAGFWQYLIKKQIPVDKIDKPIWKISFADFCGVSETGDYYWQHA